MPAKKKNILLFNVKEVTVSEWPTFIQNRFDNLRLILPNQVENETTLLRKNNLCITKSEN